MIEEPPRITLGYSCSAMSSDVSILEKLGTSKSLQFTKIILTQRVAHETLAYFAIISKFFDLFSASKLPTQDGFD